jgi:hypothetical protein
MYGSLFQLRSLIFHRLMQGYIELLPPRFLPAIEEQSVTFVPLVLATRLIRKT